MSNNAKYLISQLGLQPHPEGGHYKEVYRSAESLPEKAMPPGYSSDRPISTSIYFLLQAGEFSAFHRIKSDEAWYYHEGGELEILVLDNSGTLSSNILGLNLHAGSRPQITVLKNQWFAARPLGEFTLVSCHVAPGFHFDDFELANPKEMIKKYPRHRETLEKLCIGSAF